MAGQIHRLQVSSKHGTNDSVIADKQTRQQDLAITDTYTGHGSAGASWDTRTGCHACLGLLVKRKKGAGGWSWYTVYHHKNTQYQHGQTNLVNLTQSRRNNGFNATSMQEQVPSTKQSRDNTGNEYKWRCNALMLMNI